MRDTVPPGSPQTQDAAAEGSALPPAAHAGGGADGKPGTRPEAGARGPGEPARRPLRRRTPGTEPGEVIGASGPGPGDTQKALSPAPVRAPRDLPDASACQPYLPHPRHPETTLGTAGSLRAPSRKCPTRWPPGLWAQTRPSAQQAPASAPPAWGPPSPAMPGCLQGLGHNPHCSGWALRSRGSALRPARPGSGAAHPRPGPPQPPS